MGGETARLLFNFGNYSQDALPRIGVAEFIMSDSPLRAKSVDSTLKGNECSASSRVSGLRSTSVPYNSATSDSSTAARRSLDMSFDYHSKQPRDSESVIPIILPRSSSGQLDTNGTETDQPSLEGILALIESAVYPHCVADSSPVGTSNSPLDADRGIQGLVGVEKTVDPKEEVQDLQETGVAGEEPVSPSAFAAGILVAQQESNDQQHSPESVINTTSQRMVDDAAVPDLSLVIGNHASVMGSTSASTDTIMPTSAPPDPIATNVLQSSEWSEGQNIIKVSSPGHGHDESDSAKEEDDPEAKSPDTQMQVEKLDAKGVKESSCSDPPLTAHMDQVALESNLIMDKQTLPEQDANAERGLISATERGRMAATQESTIGDLLGGSSLDSPPVQEPIIYDPATFNHTLVNAQEPSNDHHAESPPSAASPLRNGAEPAGVEEEHVTLTAIEDEKVESLITANSTTAVESGTMDDVSERVVPLSPHLDPLVPVQDRRVDDQCLTEDIDGLFPELPHPQETADHVQPPAKPEEQESMLVEPSRNGLYQPNTSAVKHPQPTHPPRDESGMRSTGYSLSSEEPEIEESGHTALRKEPIRPLAETTPMPQSSLAAKHKIRRTFSMPVSENSVFFETPLKNAGSFSTRIQKQRLDPLASDRGRLSERQSSAMLDRIASPLGLVGNRGTTVVESPGAGEASHARELFAKGFASESLVTGEDEDAQMHSCDDLLECPPAIAEADGKDILNPGQCPHHDAPTSGNLEAQTAIPPMPDSGRPAEKSWHAEINLASSYNRQAFEQDHEQANFSPVRERPLVVFTRFKRPQARTKQVLPLASEPQQDINFPTSALTPPPSDDRKRKSAPESSKAREARAVKKLKQPFKSPMVNSDAIARSSMQAHSSAPRDLLAHPAPHFEHSTTSSPQTQSQTGVLGFSPEPGPQRLRANRIVTERLANTFSSPFSLPLKGSDTSSHTVVNQRSEAQTDGNPKGMNVMADISALERQKQILKQAIKIRNAPAEEDKLCELVTQWRQAGRDIVEMLFQVMPRPETSNYHHAAPLSSWEKDSSSLAQDVATKATAEVEEENADPEDWNYGTMMRSLQVDPHLLGWDGQAEDWVG